MRVKVRGYLTFRGRLDFPPVVELTDNGTLRMLLDELPAEIKDQALAQAEMPAGERSRGRVAILVNGQHNTHLSEGLDVQLKDGDEVAIFPPLVGG